MATVELVRDMTQAPRPAHVPPELVLDFDMAHCDRQDGDVHRYWKERAQDAGPDIFWTPRYGGHWVASRAQDIEEIQKRPDIFSNAEFIIPRGVAPRMVPLSLDPPEHGAYRRVIMPFFLPRALKLVEEGARALAIRLIETVMPRGRCEFVAEFAGIMPVKVFLDMLQLPEDDLVMLRDLSSLSSKPNAQGSAEAWIKLSQYIQGWIDKRRKDPGDDPLSMVMSAEIDGQPISDEDVLSIAILLLAGSLDTTTAFMSFVAYFLATNPEHQQRLRADKSLVPGAIQEFARRFGISNLARIVTHDTVFHGVSFAKDDMLLLPMSLVGLDDRLIDNPLQVVLDRPMPHHSTFGVGPHACVGRVLAQRELAIFLEEWLPRLPEFSLAPDKQPVFSTSLINAVEELHLVW